jgi:membrane-associated protease RseP (regulator of RpoE activity)
MPDSWTWTPFDDADVVTNLDVELLKREVGQRFPFYDMKLSLSTAVFFCRIDEETLEEKFDSLRRVLSEKGYIPMLRREKGEDKIYIIQKPKVKRKPIWVNIVLLIATIFTTTLAGSIQWIGINGASWAEMISPHYLWDGFVFFSIPLLSILGVHEMGHYFASRRHNLEASLPYFIPLPPPFILGTFGAIISTREPIPDRKTLLDVGVSGPICGFLVAIPVSLIGLFFMQQNPILMISQDGGLTIVFPLFLQWLSGFFTISPDSVIHPTMFAGWVGIFLTAVNLLPIGQLDGGHVARALLKDKHKYFSWIVVAAILGLGLIYYTGWLMFAFIILFLIGTRHQPPLNEVSPLDTKRIFIGVLALVIFVISFAPIPFSV